MNSAQYACVLGTSASCISISLCLQAESNPVDGWGRCSKRWPLPLSGAITSCGPPKLPADCHGPTAHTGACEVGDGNWLTRSARLLELYWSCKTYLNLNLNLNLYSLKALGI
jgi:hypothetical protein